MTEAPVYLVVGRGRWSSIIDQILIAEGRKTMRLEESRMRADEGDTEYQVRLAGEMAASNAAVAWICIPFGPWTPGLATAAINSGLDVIAECPWLCSPEVSDSLLAVERDRERLLGVHYEYCMLDEVKEWRERFAGGAGLTFNGAFEISRPGRHGNVANLQLGSHLMAIRQYAVPNACVGEIHCSYGSIDKRMIWLTQSGKRVSVIDFLANKQPIVQRYIHAFESGRKKPDFPFGLELAKQVAAQVGSLSGTPA